MPLALTNISLGIGGGASATSSGAPPAPPPTPPYSTQSMDFDGSDEKVTCGSLSVAGYSELSISAWVKIGSAQDCTIAAEYVGNWNRSFRFILWDTIEAFRGVYFGVYIGGTEYYGHYALDPLPTGTWMHIAGTYDGSDVQVYYNGSSGTSQSGSGNVDTNSSCVFQIGAMGSSNFTDGKIDEVAMWDSGLSASNITTIYGAGIPSSLSSLSPKSWWRMGEDATWGGSSYSIPDQNTTSGNDATTVNMEEADRVTDVPS